MPSSNIFCNIPWFELNINNDGSYDLCGCQNNKSINTPIGIKWNIKQIGIDEYWNSTRMQEKRMIKLGDQVDPMCRMCQQKDLAGYTSARQKENLKSVIFQSQFNRSYEQSPHHKYFKYSEDNNGQTISRIHSLHLNIGNACNFSCKFCTPDSSSRVLIDYKKLQWIPANYSIDSWTSDPVAWNNFTNWFDQNYKEIRVVHLIGGEPWMIEKFDTLINMFADKNMHWLNLSFTTNGSRTYTEYADKFKIFKRVEIGVSIETADSSNDYLRQGADTQSILDNVTIMQQRMPFVALTFRTVPTALSMLRYHTLLEESLARSIPIDASYPTRPVWLLSNLLPDFAKQEVIDRLHTFKSKLSNTTNKFINTKNTNNIELTLRHEADALEKLILMPVPDNFVELRRELALKLSQQDRLYNISVKQYLPEIYNWLQEHGYTD
jgi:organic radical activating enzyme